MIVFFQAFYYSKNMNHLNGIFARGLNGEFSLSDGNLPWKNVPELSEDAKNDMAHFKNMTMGGIVIMGFNTYRTFMKPLPERINVVIDRNCGSESLKPTLLWSPQISFPRLSASLYASFLGW